MDFFDPDASNASDSRRRYIFGGAHWNQVGADGWVSWCTLEQVFTANSQLLERRLLAQTHVEF